MRAFPTGRPKTPEWHSALRSDSSSSISARTTEWTSRDPFNPVPGPGVWEPTPPAFLAAIEPQMQNVTPFTIRGRDQFEVEPPPGLLTDECARDYQEVKAAGQDTSTRRTQDQTHSAHFWFEASNVGWSRIAAIYTVQNGTSLHETARLFALLNMAMADGYIAGFYWKRTHALWRPITAIRKGDTATRIPIRIRSGTPCVRRRRLRSIPRPMACSGPRPHRSSVT
ncbi:MAG TPA: hypothetical protein VMO26_06510 [Vicinamibacterales bacterium]|nr:hypothetical protein [Vicinamibacterales bacterium]